MKNEHKLIVREVPPSLNEIQGMHWGSYNYKRNRWNTLIFHASNARDRRAPAPDDFYNVVIVRHGPRKLDYDNLVGGYKMVVDTLKSVFTFRIKNRMMKGVRLGYIWDDDPGRVNIKYRQVKSRDYKTIITVSLKGGRHAKTTA